MRYLLFDDADFAPKARTYHFLLRQETYGISIKMGVDCQRAGNRMLDESKGNTG